MIGYLKQPCKWTLFDYTDQDHYNKQIQKMLSMFFLPSWVQYLYGITLDFPIYFLFRE